MGIASRPSGSRTIRILGCAIIVGSLGLAAIALPASSLPTPEVWDFIAQYEVGSTISFTIVGAIPYVMDCPTSWEHTLSATSSTPDSRTIYKVYGSYVRGELKFQMQEGNQVRYNTIACETMIDLDSPEVPAAAPPGWSIFEDSGTLLAPTQHFHPEHHFTPTRCYQMIGRPTQLGDASAPPFTGSIDVVLDSHIVVQYEPPYPPEIYHQTFDRHLSGFWIAGVGPWEIPQLNPNLPGGVYGGPSVGPAKCPAEQSEWTWHPLAYPEPLTFAPSEIDLIRAVGGYRVIYYGCNTAC